MVDGIERREVWCLNVISEIPCNIDCEVEENCQVQLDDVFGVANQAKSQIAYRVCGTFLGSDAVMALQNETGLLGPQEERLIKIGPYHLVIVQV